MPDRALHRGMDFVERTFQDLADEYLLTIAEYHWVLDESSQQLPQRFCFYVQGHGEPYCLEFPARQLAAYEGVPENLPRIEKPGQQWIVAAQMVDPDRRVDEDHGL